MSVENFTIEFEADSDGYFTYGCPYCGEYFKLLANEVQEENSVLEELFCPYCGLVDDANNFWTKEVLQYIQDVVMEWMINSLNKSFSSIKSSKYLRVDFKKIEHHPISKPSEVDDVEEEVFCSSCGKHEKVLFNAGASKVFCAYCGGDI